MSNTANLGLIIISGGTGFIGRALASDLGESGYDVAVLPGIPSGCCPELYFHWGFQQRRIHRRPRGGNPVHEPADRGGRRVCWLVAVHQ